MEETKTEVAHKTMFRFFGLSRSGNHAVINWVIRQLEGRYCFLNCAEPYHNPFVTARPLNGEGLVYDTNIEDFDLEKEQQGEFSEKDYLLYNYEDTFLGSFKKKEQRENYKIWTGIPEVSKDILILRDPFNLFASRKKAGILNGHFTGHGARPISLLTLKRIYKQHAREFLGERNNLKNKICVNFNLWATEVDYRRNLAEELDIPFSDKGRKEVIKVAGGSSFDGTKYTGEAHRMELNNRWNYFVSDEEYRSLFDPELAELTRRIFGEIPALRAMDL